MKSALKNEQAHGAACTRTIYLFAFACFSLILHAGDAHAASVTADAARQSLTGKYKGSTTCGKKVGIELELQTVADAPGVLNLKGTLRTSDVPGQPRAPSFTTSIGGQMHLSTGLMQLENIVAPVDPCAFHIGKTCFVGKAGSGGTTTWFDDKFNSMRKEYTEKKRAEDIARSTLLMAAARSEDGEGLQGTIRGQSFDCVEFVLHKTEGMPSRDLPAIGGELAMDAVSGIDITSTTINSAPSRIYWLTLAAGKNDPLALFALARAYEMGAGVSHDMSLAIKNYMDAAQRGDAKAQARLADLYEKGEDGLPKDEMQSKHWKQLADATVGNAGKLCATPQFVTAYYTLFRLMSSDPNAVFVKMFGEVLTSTQVEEGRFQIDYVAPHDVSMVERPFTCQIFGKSVGARVTSTAVPTIYEHISSSGSSYFTDNSSDVALSQGVAVIASAAMSAPVIQPFTITLITNKRYQISMSKLLVSEYVTKAVEVSIP